MEFPELAARTRRFSYGAPRAVAVTSDGRYVTFLRSGGSEDPQDALWVFELATGTERLLADPGQLAGGDLPASGDLPAHERALRERKRLSASGIGSYELAPNANVAVFARSGELFRVEIESGTVSAVPTVGPATDPQPDATGARIAYVTDGRLHVVDVTGASLTADGPGGADLLLAGEAGITWGLADFIAAEEFGRFRGHWWAPDGVGLLAARVDDSRVPRWHLADPADPASAPTTVAYPYAGADNAAVTLHVLDLDGGWVDVRWDRETYPYLVAVSWSGLGSPLLAVLRRSQQHGLILSLDPRTGETQVHAELADPRWVEPVPGTPTYLADGRVLVGGDLTHDRYDARCLFADGSLVTPPTLYVRRVVGQASGPAGTDLIIEATAGEPSEQHIYRMPATGAVTMPALEAQTRRLTTTSGWHTASVGGNTIVIGSLSLEHAGSRHQVFDGDRLVGELVTNAATPPYAPRPVLDRVTDRQLPAGVLYPRSHVTGRSLPVLVDIYGGPGHQEVISARSRWLARQWWADAGFAVVTIDNRGTPGVAPSFEKAIHRRLSDVILTDQVDALEALATKHPDLDLARVAIRGWSFGGWLAALAALRRPDVYHAAVAGAPVADWALYDTAYTERFLGLPVEAPEVYAHNNLIELAGETPIGPADARPILLIHGMVDDNVVAAHTLRLSAALLSAGRPHAMIPLPGATHMAAGGLSERLLRLELDFVRRSLPG